MSPEVVVSVISATTAVVSIFISSRASRAAARLSFEFDEAKTRASKEQQVEELMSRYREPLLRAAFDLQSRIYNIVKQTFLIRYGREGDDHEREYALGNTVFLFAEYLGWVEILRRDVQFLDLGDVERNRLLVERLEAISLSFFADPRDIGDGTFHIFRGEQRAIGELMIARPDDAEAPTRRQCIGYARFCRRMREDPSFAEWFRPIQKDVSALAADGDHVYERLTALQRSLVDLIAFLDDPPTRFLERYRTKL